MGGTVGRLLDYLSLDQRFESNFFSAMGRKERRDRVECFNAILARDCFRKCVEKKFIVICIYFHFLFHWELLKGSQFLFMLILIMKALSISIQHEPKNENLQVILNGY